mmetsp:Transcript_44166/g.99557  ORF Transcript_44166/g.99557 Transcript_44166/m.99557 type:complete len:232 (+) Transcript_44166:55-750(+)|eukprot:CAMPEP_0197893870 /NCGR_PEP_ID=MMETSP1439-20131203/33678_1 /TAXON_ID=66791 /ORGANISM="Gonyaulax spinifera, Strain CCMP409" /LENGTH=231 /DNA_ID=CAMNT_0043514169 /DNA_START=44 /DNA_END=739 /DNA_ORIENTATION=+
MAAPLPLTEEQVQELLEKKRLWAAEHKEHGACQNPKCRCVECTCGAACTCNISPDVTCDPCKTFKAAMAAKANESRLEAAEAFYSANVAPTSLDVPCLLAEEVKSRRKEEEGSLVLVDCRSDEERAVSTIPGAIAIAEFEAEPQRYGDGKLVVVFCTIGGRSAKVAQRLLQLPAKPWAEVKNFQLGILGWCHQGGELVDPAGAATNKVHPRSETMAGMFPMAGYEIVMETA